MLTPISPAKYAAVDIKADPIESRRSDILRIKSVTSIIETETEEARDELKHLRYERQLLHELEED
jgi:hypothetical protein